MTKVTLIAFAKTPGLSPLKTRLSKTKGDVFAQDLFCLSVECVAEVLRTTEKRHPTVTAKWTLAEPEAQTNNFWSDPKYALSEISIQSQGLLGVRLAHAFKTEYQENSILGFLGTDLPQISVDLLDKAIELAHETDFVMGPSNDGGFYLLLARKFIPASVWNSVTYSSPETRNMLTQKLSALGTIQELEHLTDIDTEEDLMSAKNELISLKLKSGLLPTQQKFLDYLS